MLYINYIVSSYCTLPSGLSQLRLYAISLSFELGFVSCVWEHRLDVSNGDFTASIRFDRAVSLFVVLTGCGAQE